MPAFINFRLGLAIMAIAAGAIGWFAVAVHDGATDPNDSIDRLENEIRNRIAELRDLNPCQEIWLSSVIGTLDHLKKQQISFHSISNEAIGAEFDGQSLGTLLAKYRDLAKENAERIQATVENLDRIESSYGAAIEKLETYSRPPHSDRLRRSATDNVFDTNELIREIEDSWLGDTQGYAARGSCYEISNKLN